MASQFEFAVLGVAFEMAAVFKSVPKSMPTTSQVEKADAKIEQIREVRRRQSWRLQRGMQQLARKR